MDLEQAIERYLRFLLAIQKSVATARNYESGLKQFMRFTGNTPVSNLAPSHVKGFMVHLGNQNKSPSTIRARMATVVGLYRYIIDTWGPLAPEESRQTEMTFDHLESLLPVARQHHIVVIELQGLA